MYKKRLVLAIICFIILFTTNRGIAMSDRPNNKTEIKEKFKQIDLSGSVSKEDAIIIAQNYLIEEGLDKICDISTGEVIGDLYNNPEYWHVSFSTTQKVKQQQGLKWASVYVHKKTGEVKYGGEGPS
jgi:hypothetical protein